MTKKNKQITKKETILPEQALTAETLISQAINQKVPVETLERLMKMRRELKAEWAEEQYNKAMAEFQSKCPTIQKKKEGAKTKAGQVAYYYAPLEYIVEQTKDLLSKHGFSYRHEQEEAEKDIKITCISIHKDGHSKKSSVTVPLGGATSVMSAPQVKASAITYAKRYSFCNAFGIVTGDEDNDAQGLPTIQDEQNEQMILDWQASLESAGDLTELQQIWGQIPPQIKSRLQKTKNLLKKKYANS